MKYILLVLLLFLIQGCNLDNPSIIHLKDGGIGSGAYHAKSEPKNIIYTIKEKPATIYKLKLSKSSYKIIKTIKIKNSKKIDGEALIKLKDGTFWIADEQKPSLIHIDKTGSILKRVPIHIKHLKNKGFESLAISPDEKKLYTILQTPYHKKKKSLYIYTYNIPKDKITSKYKYRLNSHKNFINEMVCIKKNTLIMLENQKNGYKFYKIHLDKQSNKKEIFSYDKLKKIEGMAYLGKNQWILINDDDDDKNAKMIRVSF